MLQNYLKRNFLLICIASALVLSGTTLASCVDSGVITQKSEEVEMAANSISSKSADKSVVEVDGVSFETLVSDSVLSVPQPGAETPVKFGVRITNKKQKPARFARFGIIHPNLVTEEGRVIPLYGGTAGEKMPEESDFPLVMPGESVTFFLEGMLSWQNDKLVMGGTDGFGGFWYFRDLKPGQYKFQFIYQYYDAVMQIYLPKEQILEGIWTGKLATPWVNINLVKT
ncbi:MAG: hypothetical protein GPI93_02035 [Microcystis aeruginosa LG13-12]|jgi:hypothetical protein|nr:hypothetical protein [Microcystis aeruginosa LG13-12]